MTTDLRKLVVLGSRDSEASLRRISSNDLSWLPFSARVSLQPVIEFWEEEAREGHPLAVSVQAPLRDYLAEYPELGRPIDDVSILEPHRRFLELLFCAFFPSAFGGTEVAAALVPFEYRSVFATPAFRHLFCHESGTLSGRVNLDLRTFTFGKTISAYLHILRTVYGVDVDFEYPVTFTTQELDTGLDRYFKVTTDLRFVRITERGALPELDEETIRRLLTNVSDLADWTRLIPPSAFEFTGVSLVRAFDVTDERMIAMLERDVVEEGSLVRRAIRLVS